MPHPLDEFQQAFNFFNDPKARQDIRFLPLMHKMLDHYLFHTSKPDFLPPSSWIITSFQIASALDIHAQNHEIVTRSIQNSIHDSLIIFRGHTQHLIQKIVESGFSSPYFAGSELAQIWKVYSKLGSYLPNTALFKAYLCKCTQTLADQSFNGGSAQFLTAQDLKTIWQAFAIIQTKGDLLSHMPKVLAWTNEMIAQGLAQRPNDDIRLSCTDLESITNSIYAILLIDSTAYNPMARQLMATFNNARILQTAPQSTIAPQSPIAPESPTRARAVIERLLSSELLAAINDVADKGNNENVEPNPRTPSTQSAARPAAHSHSSRTVADCLPSYLLHELNTADGNTPVSTLNPKAAPYVPQQQRLSAIS